MSAIRESGESMVRATAAQSAGQKKTGSRLRHSGVAVLMITCAQAARAQSDASGNSGGQAGVQHVDHNASTGARWDHDVARVQRQLTRFLYL